MLKYLIKFLVKLQCEKCNGKMVNRKLFCCLLGTKSDLVQATFKIIFQKCKVSYQRDAKLTSICSAKFFLPSQLGVWNIPSGSMLRGKTPPTSNECLRYDTKQSNAEVPVMQVLWWRTSLLPSLPASL